MEDYSISTARANLPSIVHAVEDGPAVTLTRNGKPVAMIVSMAEYERLTRGRPCLWGAIESFRNKTDLSELDIDEIFHDVRDRSTGRELEL